MKDKIGCIYDSIKNNVVSFRCKSEVAYFTNLADIHWGACDAELFIGTFTYLMSIPNLYVGIGGDAGNGATKSSKSDVVEEWSVGDKQVYDLAEIMKPYADRILYIIDGNHWAGRRKHESYFTPEKMLAVLIGKPEIYKEEFVILYFNVNKNCYVHFAQHMSPKKEGVWDWVGADVTWREHHHLNYKKEKIVIEHNKFAKKPIPKKVYEVYSGTFQIYPSYAKYHGYRVGISGCFISEMSGSRNKNIFIWSDEEFFKIMGLK